MSGDAAMEVAITLIASDLSDFCIGIRKGAPIVLQNQATASRFETLRAISRKSILSERSRAICRGARNVMRTHVKASRGIRGDSPGNFAF